METEKTGWIHSVESFGTVDGPGVRMVVFFQGCPLRCQYCHNPDTWKPNTGTKMSAEQILERYERNRSFYRNGGITATGGEPLLQLPFLTELFARAKERGIHTCLDTSGIIYRESRAAEFERLFKVTALVLLDIKHSDEAGHRALTGQPLAPVLKFARALERAGVPVIVRHVAVPGITDEESHLRALGRLLASFSNLKGLEVLPYHTMGGPKYREMGIPEPLEGIPPADETLARNARERILEEIRRERKV